MEYTAENISVMVHHYPVDGSQISVTVWDGKELNLVVDSRFISDSFWDSMYRALDYAGWHHDAICGQLEEWGIFPPEDDEE